MQHAEAHERLADLALEPGRLARLEEDASREAAELRAHLAVCQPCAANLAAWRRTWAEVGPALTASHPRPTPGGEPAPPRLQPAVRDRLLAAVASERRHGDESATQPTDPAGSPPTPPAPARTARTGRGRSGAAGPPRRALASRLPWLAAAAALIIAVGAAALSVSQLTEAERLRAENRALTEVTATLDRILADPGHRTVTLRAADGSPGGTLAWTTGRVVVVATGLPTPGAGQRYRCWVEQDGTRMPVGWMSFSGSTGYWAGSMTSYGEGLIPGARFGVSLLPDDGEGTPVLIAEL